jgi:antitoxin component YwqK of YwqJK toxin-antitoxin module
MITALERPAGVPESATYRPEFDAWEVVRPTPEAPDDAESTLYRRDGSVFMRCALVGGERDGRFSMFHPDGALAREGRYTGGELDGDVTAYAADCAAALPLRSCCVPAGARELRARYRHGSLVRQVFYDAEGRALDAKGVPWPERAAGIPADADFDEISERWLYRVPLEPRAHLDRFYALDGALSEEVEYRAARRTRVRRFGSAAELLEETHYDDKGKLHGPRLRRWPEGATCPYADPRIAQESGNFEHGQATGEFELRDVASNLVATLACGAALDDSWRAASPALADELSADAGERWKIAAELRTQGRQREALAMAARAAAQSRSRAALEAFVAGATAHLEPELRARRGQALVHTRGLTLELALEELLFGADPADAYRCMASVAGNANRAALAFVEASLLLAPERRMTHLTRALIRLELGDPDGAISDAAAIEPESEAGARFIRDSARLYYPEFRFRPELEPLEPLEAASPVVEPNQPLGAVRRQVQVYATRLGLVRAAVLAALGSNAEPRWLPPDVSSLLPDGPVELRKMTVGIQDEADDETDEVEVVDVDIDETITTSDRSVADLMRAARADWTGLCWLCWLSGLERVALPERLAPPKGFTAAVGHALRRRFVARDRLASGGLVARAKGLRGFDWEGVNVHELDRHFAGMPAAEYLEMRAVLLWSMWPENVSVFQSDLRKE